MINNLNLDKYIFCKENIIQMQKNKNKQSLLLRNKIKQFIPKFKNEDEERDFWANHSVTDYLHIFKPVKLDFSKLKPSQSFKYSR